MEIHPKNNPDLLSCVDSKHYLHLALRALSEFAHDDKNAFVNSQILDEFCHAFTDGDASRRKDIHAFLRRAGFSNDDIIDTIIPSAARQIGAQWVDDELTFAQVTISASRMQELARQLRHRHNDILGNQHLDQSVLLIIPQDEQHSLGAFVAADQMRRLGMWVHLSIGQTLVEIEQTAAENSIAMVGISGASRQSVKPVARIVDVIRSTSGTTPIILGGNIMNIVEDAREQTNVDLITSCPLEAMRFCGLPSPERVLSEIDNEL